MSQVIIGMDPHKRSATIEVMTADESVAGGGRYGTGAAGLAAMIAAVRQWPDRIWAVEGSRGTGRHVAAWLAGAGEQAWTCRAAETVCQDPGVHFRAGP
jgi:hypothetical protein